MPTRSRDELALFKFLDHLQVHLKQVRDPNKVLLYALRQTQDFFQASQACIARLHSGRAELLFSIPKHETWDLDALTSFIRHAHPPIRQTS